METSEITVTISLPWWTRACIYGCAFFAAIHGLEPDAEKIGNTIAKHIRMKIS